MIAIQEHSSITWVGVAQVPTATSFPNCKCVLSEKALTAKARAFVTMLSFAGRAVHYYAERNLQRSAAQSARIVRLYFQQEPDPKSS